MVVDEKSQLLLLKNLAEFWAALENEIAEIVNEEFLLKLREEYDSFEMNVILGIMREMDTLPIFDVEI